MTDGRRAPHPNNELNELPGEEWLYFTKSVLTTAYPSELGHVARKVHGANKPPRLMARLIEFFSKTDELVLDPFAGVGGTLIGAAIARGPRRALGIELDPRWVAVYEEVVAGLSAERDGNGPAIADLGTADPGPTRSFEPAGIEMRTGDALDILPTLAEASVDFVATDPWPIAWCYSCTGQARRPKSHSMCRIRTTAGWRTSRRRGSTPSRST